MALSPKTQTGSNLVRNLGRILSSAWKVLLSLFRSIGVGATPTKYDWTLRKSFTNVCLKHSKIIRKVITLNLSIFYFAIRDRLGWKQYMPIVIVFIAVLAEAYFMRSKIIFNIIFVITFFPLLLYFSIFVIHGLVIWLVRGQSFGFGVLFYQSYLIGMRVWDSSNACIFSPIEDESSLRVHSQVYKHPGVIVFVANWIRGVSNRGRHAGGSGVSSSLIDIRRSE